MTGQQVQVIENPAEFRRLALDPRFHAICLAEAQKIAERAAAIVPKVTGALAAGYRAEEATFTWPGSHGITRRAGAQVVNDDVAAVPVEFGNGRAREQRPLRRAALGGGA